MIERKQSFVRVLLVYFFAIILLFSDIMLKQIRFLEPFIPDCYSIIFYINILFCPLKIMIVNLFVIGIIEDAALNHVLGVSSLVYFAFIYPVSKVSNMFINATKQKMLIIFIIFSALFLAKYFCVVFVSGGHLPFKYNVVGMFLSTLLVVFMPHYR